jgi:hypothetical protein
MGSVEVPEELLEQLPNSQEREKFRSLCPHVVVSTSAVGERFLETSFDILEESVWLLIRKEYHRYTQSNQDSLE